MTATLRTLPGSAANNTATGTVAWTNPTNALSSDDSRAQAIFATAGFSNFLVLTNFGFSIPVDARVDGIKCEVERRRTAGTITDVAVHPVKAGVIQTALGKTRVEVWDTTDEVVSYGGPNDLWGTTWTPADINSSGFGVAIVVRKTDAGAGNAEIDAVWVTVYYTRRSDAQQTIVRLRSGRPPHSALIDIPASAIRYGQRLRGANTASFLLPKSHAQIGDIFDILFSDPDNPPMVTVEPPDGYLPYVGFVTDLDDDYGDGYIDMRAMDHTVRIAAGLCPQSGGGDMASGDLLRTAFAHIETHYLPLYFDFRDIRGGPAASYQFKLDQGDRLVREMENQTGYDFVFAYFIDGGRDVLTVPQWNGAAGTDRRDEEVWQDGVHFINRSYALRFRQARSGVLALGGAGAFADRVGRFVSTGGRSLSSTVTGQRREGQQRVGFGGATALIMPQTTNATVLAQAAQQRLRAPENASETIKITLFEQAVDRSRLGVGDRRRVRFSSMGKDLERDIRVIGYDLIPGDGVIGVECEVIG